MHRLLPLVVALLLVSGCTREAVAPQSALPSAPTHTDPGVRVYVTNESSGDLTVIDAVTQTVIATVPVGKRPRGIKVSPDRQSLYVALSGSPIAGPGIDRKSLPAGRPESGRDR
jgi:YVTN family beta-propeller protein